MILFNFINDWRPLGHAHGCVCGECHEIIMKVMWEAVIKKQRLKFIWVNKKSDRGLVEKAEFELEDIGIGSKCSTDGLSYQYEF